MNKPLQIALSKLKPFSDTHLWCGYLSYAEIVSLDNDGYVLEGEHHKEDMAYIRDNMSKGINGCRWVYFKKIGKTRPKYVVVERHHKS